MNNHETCPLYPYCTTKKHEHETCDDMVRRYNAGLLLQPEYVEDEKNGTIRKKHKCFKRTFAY